MFEFFKSTDERKAFKEIKRLVPELRSYTDAERRGLLMMARARGYASLEEYRDVLAKDAQERAALPVCIAAYDDIKRLVPEVASYKGETCEHVAEMAQKRGVDGLVEYRDLLVQSEEEREYLRVNLTKKGTHFFRGDDWDFFGEACLSTFAGKGPVRVWCAGCSSGEEAYSTVMVLLDHVALEDIDVLGSDYNPELLAKCDRGDYANLHYEEVPERYRHYLERGEKRFAVKEELRARVHTQELNLLEDEYPAPFDVIVCRNVIKFFSPEKRTEVKRKLVDSLAPGGFLFVSTDGNHRGAELIDNPVALGVEQVGGRGIYQKK